MMKTIICLSGKRNSGKTTAESIIKDIIGENVVSYQMATILKKIVSDLTGCDIKDLEKPNFKQSISPFKSYLSGKVNKYTYRELLINIGKLIRSYNNDIFIDDVIRFIDNCKSKYIIIPDVREEHELLELKEYANANQYKFYVFRIERPNWNLEDVHSDDKTETNLDDYLDFDATIMNDSDVKGLYNLVYTVLTHHQIINKPHKEQLLF